MLFFLSPNNFARLYAHARPDAKVTSLFNAAASGAIEVQAANPLKKGGTGLAVVGSAPEEGIVAMAELLAFTTDHVCRLTGLTPRQVRYWDKTGFFSPTLVDGVRRAFGRIYSFRDVVGLRTIAILRKQVPLQELRRVGEWLLRHHQTPWSSLRLGLAGEKVVFFDPITGVGVEARSGEQTVLAIALEPIANEMQKEAERLKERKSDEHGQIVRHRNVVHNAFTLAGTRVPTEAVWEFHQAGYKPEAIIKEFPRLTKKDVRAAILFERKRKAA